MKLIVSVRKSKYVLNYLKQMTSKEHLIWYILGLEIYKLDNLNFCGFKLKFPVSTKLPVQNFFKKTLSNILDNLKNQCPKYLTSSTYNRDHRVLTTVIILTFRYSHTFVPILPTSLIEVLSTPTPFIMGVHSMHERELSEVLDTIVVDLDGGALTLPENYTIYKVWLCLSLVFVRESNKRSNDN